jgi:serine protease Do
MKRHSVAVVALLLALSAGAYVAGPIILAQTQPQPIAIPSVEPSSFRSIVKRVLPAVVSLEAESKVTRTAVKQPKQPRKLPFDDSRIPEEFRKFFEDFKGFEGLEDSTPDTPAQGFGSGFLVDPKGIILTNNHVVSGADQVRVTLHDGRKFVSKEIRTDLRTDLALVYLDTRGENLPFLELGNSDAMEIGDRVLAFGAPFGLRGTVTSGIVSGKGRSMNLSMYEDFLQTDAAINPGNSGGPLVSLDGRVIGINTAIRTRTGGFQGVGLAIPSNMAKHVKDALVRDGVVHRGYLGVQVRELDAEVAARLGLAKNTGVVVAEVFTDTPAARGGLKAGDIILKAGEHSINEGRALQNVVATSPLTKKLDVTVHRDGKTMVLPIQIDEQPKTFGNARAAAPRESSAEQQGVSVEKLGLELADMSSKLAEDLGFDSDTRGVVVTDVSSNSIANLGGLKRGMLIAKVNNQAVSTAQEARQALESASLENGVLLQVRSPQGGVNYVLLRSNS